ncbi:GATOR complex protein NPRL3 [Halotydeus destructor]|nr:GATOR complex protein NPRL3 [Halotydeus destructor]
MKAKNKPKISENVVTRDNTAPLGVFLVKSGSKGDRLLFRYPYEIPNDCKDTENAQASNRSKCSSFLNPYSSNHVEELIAPSSGGPSELLNMHQVISNLQNTVIYGYPEPPQQQDNRVGYVDPYITTVMSLSDKVLSDLFAVKPTLCGQKFEVKINDIRFVGHPVSLAGSSFTSNEMSAKERERDVSTFNVVFAVRANASHDIVNCYHECSQRIAIALQFEESRTGYLSSETTQMLAQLNDDDRVPSDVEAYANILSTSLLAANLKHSFEHLTKYGTVHININKWITVSFCLPQKVHKLTLRHHDNYSPVGPKDIQDCFEHLRPYHGILLLVGLEQLHDALPEDASPAFFRIMNVITPTKNLLELSADSDVALPQVFHIVAQLVYWGKATVIYPLCETNIYTLHPLTSSRAKCELVAEFRRSFDGNLLHLLGEFSLGASINQVWSPLDDPSSKIHEMVWLLKNRLLLQLHWYVYFVPTPKKLRFSNRNPCARPESCDPPSSQDVSKDDLDLRPSTRSSTFDFRLDDRLSPSQIQKSTDDSLITLLSPLNLTDSECENVLRVPASKVPDDLKLFVRLCPYFNGKRHLEDIMYYENVRRSQILALIDKYRDVLLLSQYEDTAVSKLCPYKQ